MKKLLISTALLLCNGIWIIAFSQQDNVTEINSTTICNPLNLNYRFCINPPSRREAADPTMVIFKNEYYLFASKSGGYFHSSDLINWNLILTDDLPLEDYAPTVVVMNDTLYFMASSSNPSIYKTGNPESGKWQIARANFPIGMTDPCLFFDSDKRLYFFYGCSDINPIYGIELNPNTFDTIGHPIALLNSNRNNYGWERKGDYNQLEGNPWIEGAWVTKHDGKYYLQYANPGTEFKSYNDGVYVSDKPLGPYKIATHNPCSYKPEGFIAGAGHSSTFQDRYGNYWHISTMTISQKHMFERRLGLFPAFFDKEGVFFVYTGFGDFPFKVPNRKISGPEELSPGWMLLSYEKPIEVSSELPDHPKKYATDEEIRTYWSASTGNKGEWISVDLQNHYTIKAIQINFAENGTNLLGRNPDISHKYLLEYSNDNKTWNVLVDKTQNNCDVPHDYVELTKTIKARYIRLTNYKIPDGTFAITGFRIFGKGEGKIPSSVRNLTATRDNSDRCIVKLKWTKNSNAVGYNIRFGEEKNKLYHNYQVFNVDSLIIRSLNCKQKYYFTIDAFNENGINKGIYTVGVK